jgi:hypothetical protein
MEIVRFGSQGYQYDVTPHRLEPLEDPHGVYCVVILILKFIFLLKLLNP